MSRITPFLIIGAIGLTGCNAHVEDTRPGQPVKTRQDAFKEILKAFEPMGVMLRTNRYDPDRFATLASELNAISERPWAHFSADTNYPPTKARDAVWEQPAEFEQNRTAFVTAVSRLESIAKTGKQDMVNQAYVKVHDTCKACHDQFKSR